MLVNGYIRGTCAVCLRAIVHHVDWDWFEVLEVLLGDLCLHCYVCVSTILSLQLSGTCVPIGIQVVGIGCFAGKLVFTLLCVSTILPSEMLAAWHFV